jgi:hypothetical protein
MGSVSQSIYEDGQYKLKNDTWHVEDSPWKAQQIAKIIDANNITFKTMCDVGCGAGEVLRQLSLIYSTDRSFTGYEISSQAFELCKPKTNQSLRYRFGNVIDDDALYDCLLCIDVLEHVEDYMGFVRKLRAKSRYKIFHIPLSMNVLNTLSARRLQKEREDWGHLHYFTRETALATLADCGYELVHSQYTSHFRGAETSSWLGAPVRFMYNVAPHLMVKAIGGCSLIVLAV